MEAKIINVDNFSELKCIETDYWSILNFFKRFTQEWYKSRNIYFEQHHVYPKAEIGTDVPIIINLPYKYHFLAHYYRAKESDDFRIKMLNYNACQVMIGKNKNVEYIKQNFPKEFYDMKSFIINSPKGAKRIINLETKEIFNTASVASEKLGINRHRICMICNRKEDYYKNACFKIKYLSYYDESKSIEYYDKLLEYYKAIPSRKKKAWSEEDIKKRALHATGCRFVQSKSRRIIDLNTNKIYESTTKAENLTGIERHKILLSCREHREVFVKKGKCNFRYVDEEKEYTNNYSISPNNKGEKMFLDKLSNIVGTTNNGRVKTIFGQQFNSILEMSKVTRMSRSTIERYIGKFVFNQV